MTADDGAPTVHHFGSPNHYVRPWRASAVLRVRNHETGAALPDAYFTNIVAGEWEYASHVPAIDVSSDDGRTWTGPYWSHEVLRDATSHRPVENGADRFLTRWFAFCTALLVGSVLSWWAARRWLT